MQYRRFYRQGALYFFTVVTYQRRLILTNPDLMLVLKAAFRSVRQKYRFNIEALVILPDHLHTIWQLPEHDANFSTRWNQIKRYVSHHCRYYDTLAKTTSEINKRQSSIWQQRFWEHCIRDDDDFANCMDYIHYNPVKHGYVPAAKDWPFSTFHQYVKLGI